MNLGQLLGELAVYGKISQNPPARRRVAEALRDLPVRGPQVTGELKLKLLKIINESEFPISGPDILAKAEVPKARHKFAYFLLTRLHKAGRVIRIGTKDFHYMRRTDNGEKED